MCSEAFYIFVEALLKYDEKLGQFTTFLWYRLKGIADLYYRQNKDLVKVEYQDESILDTLSHTDVFDRFLQKLELQESITTELSNSAQQILAYIFSLPEKRHTFNSIREFFTKKLSWAVKVVDISLEEIKDWWHCYQLF